MGGGLAAFAALQFATSAAAQGVSDDLLQAFGYGPLREAGPELALPEGFQYRVLGVQGTEMSDGILTPPMHDGMAAFPLPNGNVRLIRNHEVGSLAIPGAAFGDLKRAYDPTAGGGATSLEIDPHSREVVREFASLSGTLRNCAGGPTPWQSWISCEETFEGPQHNFHQHHGYAFEVPAAAEHQVEATPLVPLGRFVHEAIAVDPATNIIYETEDRVQSGFYRFVPDDPARPGERPNLSSGRLQMLAVKNQPQFDTAFGQTPGVELDVQWVDIKDPNPTGGVAIDNAVFLQGWAQGGARFSRGEGCWYENGDVYFSCTNAGNIARGQIWRHTPNADGGTLQLVYESPDAAVLNFPDNICSTPKGGLVICEDSEDAICMIRGLTPGGEIFDFARNIGNASEFAGATFSPDGQTLFVNLQVTGQTVAIWGPWDNGPF
jgi:uncharacterized protein